MKSECKQLYFKLCNIFFVFVLNLGKAALQFIKLDHISDVSVFFTICYQQKTIEFDAYNSISNLEGYCPHNFGSNFKVFS